MKAIDDLKFFKTAVPRALGISGSPSYPQSFHDAHYAAAAVKNISDVSKRSYARLRAYVRAMPPGPAKDILTLFLGKSKRLIKTMQKKITEASTVWPGLIASKADDIRKAFSGLAILPDEAYALLATFGLESGFNPTILGDIRTRATGLAQVTRTRFKHLVSTGLLPASYGKYVDNWPFLTSDPKMGQIPKTVIMDATRAHVADLTAQVRKYAKYDSRIGWTFPSIRDARVRRYFEQLFLPYKDDAKAGFIAAVRLTNIWSSWMHMSWDNLQHNLAIGGSGSNSGKEKPPYWDTVPVAIAVAHALEAALPHVSDFTLVKK